jgi:hypothetical protein
LAFKWACSAGDRKTWDEVVEIALAELMMVARDAATAAPPPKRKSKPRTVKFDEASPPPAPKETPARAPTASKTPVVDRAADEALVPGAATGGDPEDDKKSEDLKPVIADAAEEEGEEPPWMHGKTDKEMDLKSDGTSKGPSRSAVRSEQDVETQVPQHVAKMIAKIQDIERNQDLPIHDDDWKGSLIVDGENKGKMSDQEVEEEKEKAADKEKTADEGEPKS